MGLSDTADVVYFGFSFGRQPKAAGGNVMPFIYFFFRAPRQPTSSSPIHRHYLSSLVCLSGDGHEPLGREANC